jgi:hypothetical protein
MTPPNSFTFPLQNGYAVFTDDKAPVEKITYEMVKDMYN